MAWNIITDFGDSAAMLPAAALLLAWMIGNGRMRAALLWATLFAAQAATVAATKIAFRGWGLGIQNLDFTGISGHSTLACSVIPIGFALLSHHAGRTTHQVAIAAGFAAGVLIGVSRIELAQHSWSEVVAGCGLGSSVALVFIALSERSRPTNRLPAPAIAAMLAAMLVIMHGHRAPTERMLTRIALHLSGHSVPYTREDLREGLTRAEPVPAPRTAEHQRRITRHDAPRMMGIT